MGKYEDLEELKKIKETGGITDKEFEVEKYKILNNKETNTDKIEGVYIASMVLGIIALLLCMVPILGLIITIVSLIIFIKAKKKVKQTGSKSGYVTAGMVLTIISLILTIFIHCSTLLVVYYGNSNTDIVHSSTITNTSEDIVAKAKKCTKDCLNNRIISFLKINEKINEIRWTTNNNETIILIKTVSGKNETVYAYNETTYYGTDRTANATNIENNEERENVEKAKRIKKLWQNATVIELEEVLNDIE